MNEWMNTMMPMKMDVVVVVAAAATVLHSATSIRERLGALIISGVNWVDPVNPLLNTPTAVGYLSLQLQSMVLQTVEIDLNPAW